jgi:hypothetical protein
MNGSTAVQAPIDLETVEQIESGSGVFLAAVVKGGLERFTSVWLSPTAPDLLYEGEVVELSTGAATVYRTPWINVVQQRDNAWLIASGGLGSRPDAQLAINDLIAVLERTTVSAEGRVDFVALPDGLLEIGRLDGDSGAGHSGAGTSRYFETASGVVVELWAPDSNALLLSGSVTGRLEPTRVDESEAWLITRPGVDGLVWRGLLMNPTPDQAIAVSGEVSVEELQAVAKALKVVSREEWLRVFPNDPGLVQPGDGSAPPTTG